MISLSIRTGHILRKTVYLNQTPEGLMKRIVLIIITAFICTAHAQFNPNLIEPDNPWNQLEAQITSMRFYSCIEGLVSRTVMTISFKDINSPALVDSMLLTFNFNLPSGSVVDSMYLWINGKPQPAALKERWSAVQAFDEIVQVNRDPALLTKNSGDSYNLQVFPFSHREERTVRICYSTPLNFYSGTLTAFYPVDLAAGAANNVTDLSLDIDVSRTFSDAVINLPEGYLMSKSRDPLSGSTVFTIDASDIEPSRTLALILSDSTLENSGMSAYCTRKSGSDISFMALLDPQKASGISDSKPKNVLIVWNMVSSSQNAWYWDENIQDYIYDSTFINNYCYDQYLLSQIISAIKSFTKDFLHTGDRINVVLNDGEENYAYSNPVSWSTDLALNISSRLESIISKNDTYKGCLAPLDFISSVFNSIDSDQPLDIIFIDQSYSYNEIFDTSDMQQREKTILNSLPEESRIFALTYENWYSEFSTIVNHIIKVKKGMSFYAYGDLEQIFSSIGRSMSERLYPAATTFTTSGTSFTYDVTGPIDERVFLGLSAVYTGKIRGETDSLTMQFTYGRNDSIIRKTSSFSVNTSEVNFDPVEKIWAMNNVRNLLADWSSGLAYNEFDEAVKTSLKYRILTDKTALIAFEPGMMDEEWYEDDVENDNQQVGAKNTLKPIAPKIKMDVQYRNSTISISCSGLKPEYGKSELSLKIFDMRGRMIADLSDRISTNGNKISVNWNASKLGAGMYLVSLKTGKTIMQKTVMVR
jgi:hypothetical protein